MQLQTICLKNSTKSGEKITLIQIDNLTENCKSETYTVYPMCNIEIDKMIDELWSTVGLVTPSAVICLSDKQFYLFQML